MKLKQFFLNHQLLFKKICLWSVLIYIILSLLILPIRQKYFHEINSLPSPVNGILDMEGLTIADKQEWYLEGTWEFYWNKWIVTDALKDAVPDAFVPVPKTWNHYDLGGEPLPNSGFASYRLLLKNCPTGAKINCSIPILGAAYRIFLNGQLVTQSGELHKDAQNTHITLSIDRDSFPPALTDVTELVIEVSACHSGGLYISPVLADNKTDNVYMKLYAILLSICIGFILLILLCSFYIVSIKDLTFQFYLKSFMTLIILFRIMEKGEIYGTILLIFPAFKYHVTSSVQRLITFFLPAAFIFWVQDVTNIKINKQFLKYTVLLDAFFCAPLLWLSFNGYLVIQSWLYVLCLSPYILMLTQLYQNIKRSVPYALTVSISFILILFSLIMANLNFNGQVPRTMSLHAPFCFVIALFLQTSIHLRQEKEMRIQALESASLKLSLKDKETALMFSQIKPHFLYNALIAIQVLCLKSPADASDAIGQFSQFLRTNMQAINSTEPIPFSQELNHIKNYAAIEKLRFKERLNIVYDIQVEDFKIPVLTIQPFLENAIKHGVCHKITGGTVTLRTSEDDNNIYIEVMDNGVGFNTDILDLTDRHGIKNITFRLKEMMRADIDIQSRLDEGTMVRISLPKEEKL